MSPKILEIQEKNIIGMRISMSLVNNRTAELWQKFMPKRKEILNSVGTDLISMSVYKPDYFSNFNPNNEFEKWAGIEVSKFENIPSTVEKFIIPCGIYAVFNYKGSSNDSSIFQYIYGTWLPNSEYQLDDRPHFEILGENYKNNDPDSEEEIWIPVKKK